MQRDGIHNPPQYCHVDLLGQKALLVDPGVVVHQDERVRKHHRHRRTFSVHAFDQKQILNVNHAFVIND